MLWQAQTILREAHGDLHIAALGTPGTERLAELATSLRYAVVAGGGFLRPNPMGL